MKTNRTVVGVDTAKRVFQLYWAEMETGEIHGSEADAGEVPGALRQSRAVFDRHGGVPRLAALGTPAAGAGPRGQAPTGEDGPAICGRQQERCTQRAGNLDGGVAARHQDGCDQERGATDGTGTAPHTSATGEVPHRPNQRPARPVGRIRRSHAARVPIGPARRRQESKYLLTTGRCLWIVWIDKVHN